MNRSWINFLVLAEPCKGWLRLLHFVLAVTDAGVLETDGDPARIDWAKATVTANRQACYTRQQSGKMENSYALVAAVMGPFQISLSKDVVNSIDRLTQPEAAEWRIPRGLGDGRGLVDHPISWAIIYMTTQFL